ncbi:hypothetical protein KA005_78815 [bacterium]|nr:hypothetical protein [bacterium]
MINFRRLTIHLCLGLFIITACDTRAGMESPTGDSCIDKFDVFAFHYPNENQPDQEKILPLDPWKTVASIPDLSDDYQHTIFDIAVVSPIIGGSKIWIKAWKIPISLSSDDPIDHLFVIFNTLSRDWKYIPANVYDSGAVVEKLYMANDGNLWGFNNWDIKSGSFDQPFLSVFDEEADEFKLVHDSTFRHETGELSDTETPGYPNSDEVYLDNEGIFWIVSRHDAIYSYDPNSGIIEKHMDISDYGSISSITFSSLGYIYLDTYGETGVIYKFDTNSDKAVPIKLPKGANLHVSFIDQYNQLWLSDSYSWRDIYLKWNIMHPWPILYWYHQEISQDWRYYSPPDPFFESSDGRIWFINRGTGEIPLGLKINGVAWFNPVTNEGCWFTSEDGNILEDNNKTLWMVVDKKLYSYYLD